MSWTFQITTGKILTPQSQLLGVGYSGNGSSLNNPLDARLRGHGPIPPGSYTMGPWYDDPPGPASKGPKVTRLIPDPTNRMYGRDAFMVHGDNDAMNHTASDGCIVAAHAYRAEISISPDQRLEVID
jgi:hypothetical protein